MPRLNEIQFAEVHGKLASKGGFTVNPFTGEDRIFGISVATEGNEMQVPVKQSVPDALEEYHGQPGNIDRFKRGASLGGWRHEGTDYFDTPTVYPNTPGGESRARNHMLEANQIAAFRLDDFTELNNPYHPENKKGDIVASGGPEEQEVWKNMPRRQPRTSGGPGVLNPSFG